MIDAISIREKLSAVARHTLSLEQFENWFVPAAWNMHQDSSEEAIELASSIHLLLSERDDRIFSSSEYEDKLLSLLNDAVYYVQVNPGLQLTEAPSPAPKSAASSSEFVREAFLQIPA